MVKKIQGEKKRNQIPILRYSNFTEFFINTESQCSCEILRSLLAVRARIDNNRKPMYDAIARDREIKR